MNVKLIDTSGEGKSISIEKTLYKETNGILLVLDAANKESLERLNDWIEDIESKIEQHATKSLVVTKIDLERVITKDEIEDYAKKHGFDCYETSAKENKGIKEAFSAIIKKTYLIVRSLVPRDSFQLRYERNSRNSGCCT